MSLKKLKRRGSCRAAALTSHTVIKYQLVQFSNVQFHLFDDSQVSFILICFLPHADLSLISNCQVGGLESSSIRQYKSAPSERNVRTSFHKPESSDGVLDFQRKSSKCEERETVSKGPGTTLTILAAFGSVVSCCIATCL